VWECGRMAERESVRVWKYGRIDMGVWENGYESVGVWEKEYG